MGAPSCVGQEAKQVTLEYDQEPMAESRQQEGSLVLRTSVNGRVLVGAHAESDSGRE